MTRSTVELIVNASKALNPLRAVNAASKKTQQAVDKLKQAVQRTAPAFQKMRAQAESALQKIKAKAKEAAASFKGFGKAAAIAAGSAAALAGLRFAFIQAGELERQTKSLQVLTGSLKTAKGIISDLQAFGAVTPFTSQELIETAKRMKAFGFETGKVVGITKRLADVAGATGADLGGIATAFGQIQAKGRLQGEELLQLQERGVALQDELRKMYGLTGEEFSKALQKGQIGAESVEAALIRLTEKGGKYANGAIAQSDTLFGKLSTLQDAIGRLGQNIGQALSPIFKFLITQITNIANSINNLFARIEARRAAIKELRESGLKGANLRKAIRDIDVSETVAAQAAAAAAPTPKIPALLRKNAAGGGDGSGRERVDMSEKMLGLLQDRINLSKEGNKVAIALKENEMRMLEIQESSLKPRERIAAQLRAEEMLHKALRAIHQENLDLFNDQKKIAQEAGHAFAEHFIKRATNETDLLKDALKGVGDILGNQLMNAIDGLINKTMTFNDVLRSTLSQVGKLLMTAGLNSLAGSDGVGILSFLGFGTKANGGPVAAGSPYMVGERGPELFVPGQDGGVMRNEDMRRLMGRSPASSGNAGTSMNFTFETTSIGGTEYVSREQLEKAMATTRRQAANDGAKRGMNMTLDRMQNSPRTRSRIGIS